MPRGEGSFLSDPEPERLFRALRTRTLARVRNSSTATQNQATSSHQPSLDSTNFQPTNNIIDPFEENPFHNSINLNNTPPQTPPQPLNPPPHMAALRDHNRPNHNDTANPINFGTLAPNNFEIHPAHAHLRKFKSKVSMMKRNGVSEETLRLMLFPFSLRDKADRWLNVHPPNTFTTWDELAKAFLAKYYPSSKTAMLRNEIHTFQQEDGESLGEAWDRYQDLIARCPHHGIPAWYITQTFFQSLLPRTKEMVNASTGRGFDHLGDDESASLIKKMVDSESNYGSRGNVLRRSSHYPKENFSNSNAETNAKLDLLTKQFEIMNRKQVHQASSSHGPAMEEVSQAPTCEACGGMGHTYDVCTNCWSKCPPQ